MRRELLALVAGVAFAAVLAWSSSTALINILQPANTVSADCAKSHRIFSAYFMSSEAHGRENQRVEWAADIRVVCDEYAPTGKTPDLTLGGA